jgi:hypothetical protein
MMQSHPLNVFALIAVAPKRRFFVELCFLIVSPLLCTSAAPAEPTIPEILTTIVDNVERSQAIGSEILYSIVTTQYVRLSAS